MIMFFLCYYMGKLLSPSFRQHLSATLLLTNNFVCVRSIASGLVDEKVEVVVDRSQINLCLYRAIESFLPKSMTNKDLGRLPDQMLTYVLMRKRKWQWAGQEDIKEGSYPWE